MRGKWSFFIMLIIGIVFVACGGDEPGAGNGSSSSSSSSAAPADQTLVISFQNGYAGFASPQLHFFLSGSSGQNLSAVSNSGDTYYYVTNVTVSGSYGFTFQSGSTWESSIVGSFAEFDRSVSVAANATGTVNYYVVSWNKQIRTSAWANLSPVAYNITNCFGGSYVYPGCSKVDGGSAYLFSVFAPNHTRARLAGNDFPTAWDGVDMSFDHRSGYWWYKFSGSLTAGSSQYKFILGDSSWISDPYGRSFVDDGDANAIYIDPDTYTWGDGSWSRPSKSELIIYEMQVEDFTRGDSGYGYATGAQENFIGVTNKIAYLTNLGVNAVEIMPIAEWPGGWYSWGYNNCGYFAPENSLATSGNEDDGTAYTEFKKMVDALHQAGIAVILDVVYNHSANDNNYMWTIDQGYYFNPEGTPWGNKIEMRNPMVQKFFLDNLKYWMDEFHIDGFRFDGVYEMDGASLISVVDKLYDAGYTDHYYIFETWDSSGLQAANSGYGKDVISSWGNAGYKSTIWGTLADGWHADLGKVTYYSKDSGFNYPHAVINYHSSHDEGTLTGRVSASTNQVKVAAVHLLTALGIPMIWMGEEVARPHYGNHPPSGSGTDESNNEIDWDTLKAANPHLYGFFAALIKLRKAHPNLRLNEANPNSVGDPSGTSDSFDWASNWTSILGYEYKASDDRAFVILINYGSGAVNNYPVRFPTTDTYYLMCDGVQATNTGTGFGSVAGNASSDVNINIPGRSGLIYMSATDVP